METPFPQPSSEQGLPPEDSGLRCPQCQYNLTGLGEDRCPECGTAFDPELLRREMVGKPGPIPGWNDPDAGNFAAAFLRTCWMTWFRPREFAQRFPPTFSAASARRFGLMTRITAVALLLGGGSLVVDALAHRRPPPRPLVVVIDPTPFFLLGTAWSGVIGSLICELTLVAVLNRAVGRRISRAPQQDLDTSTSWWGLVGFHSSFLLITAATSGLVGAVVIETRTAPRFAWEIWVLLAGNIGWWWYCLATGILAKAAPGRGRTAAIALIPVAGLAGVIAGAAASFCCVSLF